MYCRYNGEDSDMEEDDDVEEVSDFSDDIDAEEEFKKETGGGIDPENAPLAFDEDSDEENDDCTIRKTDSLIVAARAENDFSSLEVYVFDEKSSSLYVHHDVMLSSYPLCMDWLPANSQGEQANFLVVGTFLPEIEIWNLD